MTQRWLWSFGCAAALGGAAALTGCGGFPPPNTHMATAMSSVRAASEVGAEKDPQAALHLKLAQEQLDQAKQLMNDGDNKRADFVLSRAEADAELAVAQAREADMRSQAQAALDKLSALKQRSGR